MFMEELELVILSFISDASPSQVQELTAAAARLLLTTVQAASLGIPRFALFLQAFREATLERHSGIDVTVNE